MMGKVGGEEGEWGRSSVDEEDLYTYVRSFVGKNRLGDRLTRDGRDGGNAWGASEVPWKGAFS